MKELFGDETDKHVTFEYNGTSFSTRDSDDDLESDTDGEEESVDNDSDDDAPQQGEANDTEAQLDAADDAIVEELDPIGDNNGGEMTYAAAVDGRNLRRSRRIAGHAPEVVMPEDVQSDEPAGAGIEDEPPPLIGRPEKRRVNDPFKGEREARNVFLQMIKKKQDQKHGQMSLNQGLKLFRGTRQGSRPKGGKIFHGFRCAGGTTRVRVNTRRERGVTTSDDDIEGEKDR